MRIAHVTDFYLPRLGGIEMHVQDLATRQAAQGHDVTIITSSPSGGSTESPELQVVRLTDDLRRPSALHPRAPFAGARVLAETAPDVVHVHVGVGTPLAFWAARSCVRRGMPTALTNHSLWSGWGQLFRALDAAGGWSRGGLAWSAVSEAAARPMRAILPDHCPVSVVSNGIDESFWSVDADSRDDDEIVLLAVMRLAARKRSLPMLRMVRELRERVPATTGLTLLVVGDGPQRPNMERYVRRHDMGDYVQLRGRHDRTQIRDLYRRADAFLAPADLESFGIAALEARCAGVPVVAKAGTGIAEFVEDGRHGLIADSDAAMVDALERICVDGDLRTSMRGPGGTEHTSWPEVLAATEQLYVDAGAVMTPRLVQA